MSMNTNNGVPMVHCSVFCHGTYCWQAQKRFAVTASWKWLIDSNHLHPVCLLSTKSRWNNEKTRMQCDWKLGSRVCGWAIKDMDTVIDTAMDGRDVGNINNGKTKLSNSPGFVPHTNSVSNGTNNCKDCVTKMELSEPGMCQCGIPMPMQYKGEWLYQ